MEDTVSIEYTLKNLFHLPRVVRNNKVNNNASKHARNNSPQKIRKNFNQYKKG